MLQEPLLRRTPPGYRINVTIRSEADLADFEFDALVKDKQHHRWMLPLVTFVIAVVRMLLYLDANQPLIIGEESLPSRHLLYRRAMLAADYRRE